MNKADLHERLSTEDCPVRASNRPVEPWNVGKQRAECASSDFDATSPSSRCPAQAHHTQQIFETGGITAPAGAAIRAKPRVNKVVSAGPSRLGQIGVHSVHTRRTLSQSQAMHSGHFIPDEYTLSSPWVNTNWPVSPRANTISFGTFEEAVELVCNVCAHRTHRFRSAKPEGAR
jgi:hypothetical protein